MKLIYCGAVGKTICLAENAKRRQQLSFSRCQTINMNFNRQQSLRFPNDTNNLQFFSVRHINFKCAMEFKNTRCILNQRKPLQNTNYKLTFLSLFLIFLSHPRIQAFTKKHVCVLCVCVLHGKIAGIFYYCSLRVAKEYGNSPQAKLISFQNPFLNREVFLTVTKE